MTNNGHLLTTPQAVNNAIWSVCDIMRRSNLSGAIDYVPEVTWILFLRILDEREENEAAEAQALGIPFTPSLEYPYRWRDWAAPKSAHRKKLFEAGQGNFFKFVNESLLPHLHSFETKANSMPRQRVISQIMSSVERVRVDTEKNFLDILDKIHEIQEANIDTQHQFPLSQAFEGLLLRLGESNNDGGQFFTPREVIRAIVRVINPQIGETIYDPACGTGGFLAQAYEQIWEQRGQSLRPAELEVLKQYTFYGREKATLIYPIALSNLVLHGIDEPHIWHGNTLTGNEQYGGLFQGAPELYDVILTNPPFGGKEGSEAQTNFAYKTSATTVLFLQHLIDNLKPGGRCGVIVDEGVLFRTNEGGFVQTKRKLLDDCDVWCIVSLPAGTFIGAGGGVKTNILFFTKGQPTERIWYYDLSHVKVTKRNPLTLNAFSEFFELLPERADSPHSWTIERAEIENRNFDLKAFNPNASIQQDTRTPEELIANIEEKGREVHAALERLKKWNKGK
jgi:type I restriction enzyme M protein